MSVANGRIPDSMLAALGWPEADHLRLRPDAAASLNALAAAFEAHFGYPLYLSDAYRTYASQVALKVQKGPYAATPGTSNHGLGVAIDVASRVNIETSAEHRWFEANAPCFGWVNPAWAVDWNPANGQHEPWHWEYRPEFDQHDDAPTSPTAQPQEDDMPTMNEFLNHPAYDGGPTISQVLKDLSAVPAGLYTGGPAVDSPTPGSIVALIRAIPEQVWATAVRRGDTSVPALQELADAKTLGQAILTLLQQGHGDVDEAALAAALAPLVSVGVRSLSDADVAKVAKAAADEQDRRDRERLA